MIEIIPAILQYSVEDLRAELENLRGATTVVQIDIVGKNFLATEEALPLWDEFDFEFDLMLPRPDAEVEGCIALGASRLIVHAREKGAHEALVSLQHLRGGSFSTQTGIALPVDETPRALEPFEGLYDYVQVMGIVHEGSQGQPFDERAIALVRDLRTQYPSLVIQVDGGVDHSNAKSLVDAGASRLVVGHVIRTAADPHKEIEALRALVNTQ